MLGIGLGILLTALMAFQTKLTLKRTGPSSLGFTVPKDLLKAAGLKEGDEVGVELGEPSEGRGSPHERDSQNNSKVYEYLLEIVIKCGQCGQNYKVLARPHGNYYEIAKRPAHHVDNERFSYLIGEVNEGGTLPGGGDYFSGPICDECHPQLIKRRYAEVRRNAVDYKSRTLELATEKYKSLAAEIAKGTDDYTKKQLIKMNNELEVLAAARDAAQSDLDELMAYLKDEEKGKPVDNKTGD